MRRITLALGIALLALAMADIATTAIFMSVDIGLEEGNALAARAFAEVGQWPVYLAKMLITSAVVWTAVSLARYRVYATAAAFTLTICCVMQALTVRHNISSIVEVGRNAIAWVEFMREAQ